MGAWGVIFLTACRLKAVRKIYARFWTVIWILIQKRVTYYICIFENKKKGKFEMPSTVNMHRIYVEVCIIYYYYSSFGETHIGRGTFLSGTHLNAPRMCPMWTRFPIWKLLEAVQYVLIKKLSYHIREPQNNDFDYASLVSHSRKTWGKRRTKSASFTYSPDKGKK